MNGVREGLMIVVLGSVLILTALAMLAKPLLNRMGRELRTSDPPRFRRVQLPLTVFGGAILGFLVALTSIGAGALGAVMLVFLYPLRLTPARLVGTDLAHAIPLALVAGAGHILLGNVDFALLGQLLLGSVPGVALGAYFGGKLPEGVLRTGIAVVLAAVGVKLIG